MRDETRQVRQQQIENAAYEMLEEKGYAATSMIGIARRARASNETLYSWFGDKRGLFKALVTRNAAEVRLLLEAELTSGRDALVILGLLGPRLLELLLGNRAVALNRAAAADPTGELGETLSQAGRESILPLLHQVLEAAKRAGHLSFERSDEAAGLYLDLLVGDLQIRRVIGRMAAPSPEFCNQRADLAVRRLGVLLA
jgi:AcrR family transcriptional regulator